MVGVNFLHHPPAGLLSPLAVGWWRLAEVKAVGTLDCPVSESKMPGLGFSLPGFAVGNARFSDSARSRLPGLFGESGHAMLPGSFSHPGTSVCPVSTRTALPI